MHVYSVIILFLQNSTGKPHENPVTKIGTQYGTRSHKPELTKTVKTVNMLKMPKKAQNAQNH